MNLAFQTTCARLFFAVLFSLISVFVTEPVDFGDLLVAPSRGLGDILDNPSIFDKWLKHRFPSDKPFSGADSKLIWDKLVASGRKPRLDAGHPGTQWPGPHINIPGTSIHIPVDPGFAP